MFYRQSAVNDFCEKVSVCWFLYDEMHWKKKHGRPDFTPLIPLPSLNLQPYQDWLPKVRPQIIALYFSVHLSKNKTRFYPDQTTAKTWLKQENYNTEMI